MLFRRSLFGLAWVACLGLSAAAFAADPVPGTQPLTVTEPLDKFMINGINKFCLREIEEGIAKRETLWKRDYASPEAYVKSVEPNRHHFKESIGAVDPRVPATGLELISTVQQHSLVGKGPTYTIHAVRWQVLENVSAEGLLLVPNGAIVGRVVAVPDADWSPEAFCGLQPGVDPQAQLPRRFAEHGYQVLVPTLISREDTLSGSPFVAYTNQSQREFLYRQSFEMGRHIIGYEVQKILAAVDQFEKLNQAEPKPLPIGVAGVGEGGLLALYSGALDTRIQATYVCGYFQAREGVWEEPIYRNVWNLLREFGDAGVASLFAPRALIIEACGVPEVAGPHPVKQGRRGGSAPGKITTAVLAHVRKEYDLAKIYYEKLKAADKIKLVASGEGDKPAGSPLALTAALAALGSPAKEVADGGPPQLIKTPWEVETRQKRQFDELQAFTQLLLRRSAMVRDKLWNAPQVDRKNLESWAKTAPAMREHVWQELIGKLPDSTMPLNPRSRQVLDEPGYLGYEVVLDVYPDVVASGILLLPKDLKPGEKRPVVVCQHGLEGVPMDTITRTGQGFNYYSAFAHELANRGFITYSPQNPYRGNDEFRTLQRKSNPMKRSLFSYIIPQHARTLEWLAGLSNVDPQRIAFYGLSYGGKTAVRVPPMLEKYCLSICSADFNEWVLKNTTTEAPYSYVFTPEYEIFEWNMGHVANYAELSSLMTPRPFMVERGHFDGVAPDEWVAWEFSKVKRHYDLLGIGDQTELEVFTGPHKIHGVGTYEFLHKHLKWAKR
jgi:cephalosporin-C deacetylase-like acetyl esterase